MPVQTLTLKQGLSDSDKWNSLFSLVEIREIGTAFEFFRRAEIQPILIKGWAVGRQYPASTPRYSTDIDLAFSVNDYERAQELVRSQALKGKPIDLHCELRQLDTLSWERLFDRSTLVNFDDVPVRILAEEDHLRVLCVHWLVDRGWNKERLWDIYYAVDRRSVDFNWSECLDVVSERRRRWIICTIGLAHRYFQLPIDDLPFAEEAKNLPNWLTRAVEREWANAVQLLPIRFFVREPKQFFKQLSKRLPPNAIYATVDMEGTFDAKTRIHYQVGSLLARVFPTIRRLFAVE